MLLQDLPRKAIRSSIASPKRPTHSAGAALAAAALLLQPAASLAQDRDAPPRIEDLIPDSAVENPEAWAQQGVPAETIEEEQLGPELDPDSPLADIPQISVPWPDDLVIPEPEPLTESEDVRFADIVDETVPVIPPSDLERISPELAISFPTETALFPVRDEFLDRYKALSTIEALDSDEDSLAQLSARAREDEELLGTLLRVYGYYDAQVIRSVGAIEPGSDVVETRPGVRFDVIPGQRYRFGAIDLGELTTAPDAAVLRRAFEIQPGDFLSSDKIVEEQADLDRMLGETGYAFAEIDAPELLIDHARIEGDLTLAARPKGKYVFGGVNSNLPEFLSSEHLADIARFDPGDVFQRSLQLDLRRAITATGLVASAEVTPREVTPPIGDRPGVVALDVDMTKAKLRTIAGAIGYGTGEGVRIEGSWEHRNLFPPEGSLRVRGIAGTREQLAGVTFRKNNFTGRDKILTLDAYVSTIDSDAFDANTASLIGTFERRSNLLFQKPLSYSFGLELVATDERPAAVNGIARPRQTYFVAAIPLYALIDSTDDLLDPTEGFRLGGRASPEVSRSLGVESFYLRSQVDASYYQRVTEKVVLAGRVAVGSIPGASLQAIAPSRRLYAGGGGSVRGYGYQQIGPRDPQTGEPLGGRSLVEGSIEARIRTAYFDGALEVVPFVDAGSVSTSTTPDFSEVKIGVGVGVRYHTGFGPLRLDVATPLNPGPNDSPVAVYISLGQAF